MGIKGTTLAWNQLYLTGIVITSHLNHILNKFLEYFSYIYGILQTELSKGGS